MPRHAAQRPSTARQPGVALSRVLVVGTRYAAAGLLATALLAAGAWNAARAFNVYADHFVNLSARPLAMGGAAAALQGPASVFSNPAGLAGVRRFTLLYNHSARHFPGSQEGGEREWDQLDGDTEAIAVPLPLGTYAHGFTLSGELGYDYHGHPVDGALGYPREHVWGSESYDAYATSFGLPVAAGYALRRNVLRFDPAPEDAPTPAWLRLGEGTQWGVQARVWPGLDWGRSELRMDYDWTVLGTPAGSTAEAAQKWPAFSSREKLSRSGWALHPTGWLTLVQDSVDEQYIFDKKGGLGVAPSPFLGVIHTGNQRIARLNRGAELSLGELVRLRCGNYDGKPTLGLALNVGGLWLNYSEAKDLLPGIVGIGKGFADLHIYGFDWAW